MLCKHKLDAIKYAIKASFQRELCLDAAKCAIQNMLFKFAISNLLCIVLCNSITQTVEIWRTHGNFFFLALRAAACGVGPRDVSGGF